MLKRITRPSVKYIWRCARKTTEDEVSNKISGLERLANATRQEPLLSKVHLYVREGWPAEVSEELKPYM